MPIFLSQMIDEAWVTPTFGKGGPEAGTYWDKPTAKFHYTPPLIDVTDKGREDEGARAKATRLFYDFYAMQLLHMWLGSTYPTNLSAKDKQARQFGAMRGALSQWVQGTVKEADEPEAETPDADEPPDEPVDPKKVSDFYKLAHAGNFDPVTMTMASIVNWPEIEEPPEGVGIVPHQLRTIIEEVYEEVTIAITRRLLAHLRLTLIQEFRYIVTHASDWIAFRKALLSYYNKNGKITKEEFDRLIAEKIPGFKSHKDAVKRLLLFCKFYHKMGASDNTDPADSVPSDEPEVEPTVEEPPLSGPPEPEEPTPPEGGWETEPTEVPPGADWESDKEAAYKAEIEKEKLKQYLAAKKKGHVDEGIHDPGYAAGRLSPSTIRAVKKAVDASGLTWDDVLLAYKNLNWGGAYGGPKWGEGVAAFIQLMPKAKTEDVEEMAALVDRIYDLDHNTGALLNKGGMYVDYVDLDRRSKITHLARFLPNVSPMIKRLILLVLKYVSKRPDIEKNIEQVTHSPTKEFTPDQMQVLAGLNFAQSTAGPEFVTQAPFINKRNKTRQRNYIVKAHESGLFSLSDSMDADVRVFENFEEMAEYLKPLANDFIMPQPGVSSYSPEIKPTAKDKYINSHVKIKLDAAKETQLLDVCKMAWRPSNSYYKAYLPGDDRFQFFAFNDGSFMGCLKSTPDDIGVFKDWNAAFDYCKSKTIDALPNSEEAEGKAWIGKPIGSQTPSVAPGSQPQVGAAPGDQYEYSLAPAEYQLVYMMVKAKNNLADVTQNSHAHDGMTVVGLNNSVKFAVGKKAITPTGKKYRVKHYLISGIEEEWSFPNWNTTNYFITNNFSGLMGDSAIKDFASVSPQIMPSSAVTDLPPHSPSQASYKLHLGIQKPPTHTIRLTVADENGLAVIGFEPKMIGSDVWYIHKTKDTVKFYPNDTAKIMFTSKKSGYPVVTKKIADALAWLKANYSVATAQSPLIAPTPASTKGTKVTAIFDKIIADAGFHWDDASGTYQDSQAHATLTIAPYPQSTLVFQYGDIPPQKFKTLPALGAYLKGEYPAQKKSTVAGLSKLSFPKQNEVVSLLAQHHFQFTGYTAPPHSSSGKNGYFYENQEGASVIIHPDGSGLYEAKDGYKYDFANIDALIKFLSKNKEGVTAQEYEQIKDVVLKNGYKSGYYGQTGVQSAYVTITKKVEKQIPANYETLFSIGALSNYYVIYNEKTKKPIKYFYSLDELLQGIDALLKGKPFQSPNELSEQQKTAIEDLCGIYGAVAKESVISDAEGNKFPAMYILSNWGSKLWAVNHYKGMYEIYKILGNTWDKMSAAPSFSTIFDFLKNLLNTYMKEKEKPLPTPELDPAPQKGQVEIHDLLIGNGFTYSKPEGDEPFTYVKENGEMVEYVNDGTIRFTHPGVLGPLVWKTSEEFETWFKDYYLTNSLPATADEIIDGIWETLKNVNALTSDKKVKPDKKVNAIKAFRFYLMGRGIEAGLANSKWAVENLPAFLAYVKGHGLPNVANNSPSLDTLIGTPTAIQPGIADNTLSNDELLALGKHVTSHSPYLQYQLTTHDGGRRMIILANSHPTYLLYREEGKYYIDISANNAWHHFNPNIDNFLAFAQYVAQVIEVTAEANKSQPSNVEDKLSASQIKALQNLVNKFGPEFGGGASTGYKKIDEAKKESDAYDFVISIPEAKKWYRIRKKDGMYLVEVPENKKWLINKEYDSFQYVFKYVAYLLSLAAKALNTTNVDVVGKLTDEEVKQVRDLVMKYYPGTHYQVRRKYMTAKGAGKVHYIAVVDKESKEAIWAIGKTQKGSYKLFKVWMGQWENAAETSSFEGMYDVLNKAFAENIKGFTPEGELPSLLEKYGFEYKTTKVMTTKTQNMPAKVYANDEGEEIRLFDNGQSQVNYMEGDPPALGVSKIVDFENISQLVEFLKEHFGTPTVDSEYDKTFDYLAYLGFTTKQPLDEMPITWEKDGESVTINHSGISFFYPLSEPSHQNAASAQNFPFETMTKLRQYLTEKYTKTTHSWLGAFIKHWGLEKKNTKAGGFKGTTDVWIHNQTGIMIYTMPSGGGVFKTDLGYTPEMFTSFKHTYDLAFFATKFFMDHQISADGEDPEEKKVWTTGDTDLDDLIHEAGLVYQGQEAEGEGYAQKFMAKDGRTLKVHYDKSASFKYPDDGNWMTTKGLGWNDLEGLKDFLVHHVETLKAGPDAAWAKNAGYAMLTKTLAHHGFKEGSEGLDSKMFTGADHSTVTLWSNGNCGYSPASPTMKNKPEYFSSYAELDDHLKSIYGGVEAGAEVEGGDSILTYEEAKPVMFDDLDLANWSKSPDWIPAINVSFQHISPSGGGEIQIEHKKKLKFAIGMRPDSFLDSGKIWYVRQKIMTGAGKKIYTFTTKNNMINWMKENIDKLLSWTPVSSGTETGEGLGSPYYPDEDVVKLIEVAGFEPDMLVNGTEWVHPSKFSFILHENGIVWKSEKSHKEITLPKSAHPEFLSLALAYAKPTMNDAEMDFLFSQATASDEENLLEKMVDLAEKQHGAHMQGSEFAKKMQKKGFLWDEQSFCFVHEELYQVVVVTPHLHAGGSMFRVWWIDPTHKDIKTSTVSDQDTLFTFIGPTGKLAQQKEMAAQMGGQAPVLDPEPPKPLKGKIGPKQSASDPPKSSSVKMPWSDYDYSNWANGKNLNPKATISLIPNDNLLMHEIGFKIYKQPNGSFIYLNHDGDEVRFYVDGTADLKHKDGKPIPYHDIKLLVEILWKMAHPVVVPVSTSQITAVPSPSYVKTDAELKKLGFKMKGEGFYEKYDKKIHTVILHPQNATLEYMTANNKIKKGHNKMIEHWTLPIADGIAKLKQIYGYKEEASEEKVPFSEFDYAGMATLAKQQGKKPNATSITLVPQDVMTLDKLGFMHVHDPNETPEYSNSYVSENDESLYFYADGSAEYRDFSSGVMQFRSFKTIKEAFEFVWEKVKKGQVPYSGTDYKLIYAAPPKKGGKKKLPPNHSIPLVPHDEKVLKGLGFIRSIVKSEDDPAFKVSYANSNGEVAYFFASGSASYWNKGEGPKYFNSPKELMQFLWSKYHFPLKESVYKNFMKKWME